MPGRAAKKRRRFRLEQPEQLDLSRKHGDELFGCLPLEMIAEILAYLCTPDLLALARTSRFFADLLVYNKSLEYIWRNARKQFLPLPIPDPAPNWTETSYAAFLFDPAPCEVCEEMTKTVPYSCSLRARICTKVGCGSSWIYDRLHLARTFTIPHSETAITAAIQSWLPYYEGDSDDRASRRYRVVDWGAAANRYREAAMLNPAEFVKIQEEFAQKAKILPRLMQEAKNLLTWCKTCRVYQAKCHTDNELFLRNKAAIEDWNESDFITTPLYRDLIKRKDALYELITETEYGSLKEEFREQVATRRKQRIQASVDSISRSNREDLRRYWSKLKTFSPDPMPCYGEFRRLDICKVLLQKNIDKAKAMQPVTDSLWTELKQGAPIEEHIRQQINTWLDDTRAKLAEKLGYKHVELDTAAGFTHPTERLTAWFVCINCNTKKKKDVAMTFKDVCGHQCPPARRKDRSKAEWNIDWFQPDKKAVAAMKQLLRIMSLDERKVYLAYLNNMLSPNYIICKSCPKPIVLSPTSLLSHCKRHESIILEILPSAQLNPQTVVKPRGRIEDGLVAKLNGYERSAKKERALRGFECRHCPDDTAYTFDGLVSHLKAKHSIETPGDEDVYSKPKL
ncbi:hypothetical protein M422DRAFT_32522 [Sphaerobolus stellatus SS14]|uniref:F-box domain-containing protein n=1 Tax=Sphaerobolus stellatus (strain SS14) TaxID=990650 RepID=A0A0C9VQ11_SPHS4|nr:hypothetical protein M422DRAFT_32522 [Sphaerobolus stellatus SS14]